MAGRIARRWLWRRGRKPDRPPEWPTVQTTRPTWATERTELLPAVRPYEIRECDG